MKRRSFVSLLLIPLLPTILTASKTVTRTVNISAAVEDEYAPYVVDGIIKNEETGVLTTLHKVVTRGTYSKVVTGPNLILMMSITASRAGSKTGYLQLNENVASIRGGQRVMICNYKPVA